MLRALILSVACALVLAACGGGDPEPEPQLDASTGKMLTDAFLSASKQSLGKNWDGCMATADYQTMVSRGTIRPIPPDAPPAGSIWHPPYLLVPVPVNYMPFELAPGMFVSHYEVPGPNGPMHMRGPYYIPGETPPYVCSGGT